MTMIDPRPPPQQYRTKPRISPILTCETCSGGLVFRKGNANRFCSRICARVILHDAATIAECASLWAKGESVTGIAAVLGVTKGAVSGITDRNRHMFPKRPSPIR